MALVGPLGVTDRYQNFLITTVAIFGIITLSISELAGLAGIWSVGHMAFVAIGAYSLAYFSHHGLALPLIVLFAMATAAVVGFLLGLTAGRFEVLYLAILTLALALVALEVIGKWTSVTGGDLGTDVKPVTFFGSMLRPTTVTEIAIGTSVALFVIVDIAARGRFGRRWLAIKNQRLAAIAIGYNPTLGNAAAFGASAAVASIAGVLLALQIGYISAETFNLTNAINFIVAAVVGGVGSIAGAVLGTGFIVVVPEVARKAQDFQVILFGAVTIAVLLFLPEGIVPGLMRRAGRLLWGRTRSEGDEAGSRLAKAELIEPLLGHETRGHDSMRRQLVMKHVNVKFGGLAALQNVEIDVNPGEIVALIGPNGAGKTTLLNVLAGFVKPVPGSIATFGGRNLLGIRPQQRPRIGIGRTFQHAELFAELTVLEAVSLAAQHQRHHAASAREFALEVLRALGLGAYGGELPAALPFGIQKRVDIARALATMPELIVMDEPFSGLDLNEQEQLHQLILAFKRARLSVLLVDHAVQQVLTLADRVFVLDNGALIASGVPEEIRNSKPVREAYFGRLEVSA